MIYCPVSRKKAIALLEHHSDLVVEDAPPTGRGHTSIGVPEDALDKAWQTPTVNQCLPWRFRKDVVNLRLFPVPAKAEDSLFQTVVAPEIARALQTGLGRQFGGRCQSCGEASLNRRGRRIAPMLYTSWLHTPHPNPVKRTGMRELIGVASVCPTCFSTLSIADHRPCPLDEPKARPEEMKKAVQRLAAHNHWSMQQTLTYIRKLRGQRESIDQIRWVYDLDWLTRSKLIAQGDLALTPKAMKLGYILSKGRLIMPPAVTPSSPASRTPNRSSERVAL